MARFSQAELERLDQEARARYERHLKLLLPSCRRALGSYLAAVRRRIDGSGFGLVAAAPLASDSGDPRMFGQAQADQLGGIITEAQADWTAALTSTLMPGIRGMLGHVPMPSDDPAVLHAAAAWRSEWLTERQQILVGVPDEITAQLRAELDRLANERGTSVYEAKLMIREKLGPSRMDWEAQRIARTEVVSANNQGMLASWRALLATMGGGAAANKTWIGGQRPTHSAVSGTTIGINEKFQVGDSEMDGPGDSAGGPGEVCNCGCSLSFEIADQPVTTSDTGDGGQSATEDGTGAETGEDAGPGAGDDGGGDDAGGGGEITTGDGGEPGATFDYSDVTDEELSGLLSQAADDNDEAAIDRILQELDRRDTGPDPAADPAMRTLDPAQAAADAEYDRLIDAGTDPERAFTQVYGQEQETTRVQQGIKQLRSLGYQGRGWEQLTQAAFQEEADRMYWLAESMGETKGVMLNQAGLRAGIDPGSLFTGPESRARKYASEELRAFWQKYGRLTVDDVRAGILGGAMRSAGTAAWA